jgi:hypothetical protein
MTEKCIVLFFCTAVLELYADFHGRYFNLSPSFLNVLSFYFDLAKLHNVIKFCRLLSELFKFGPIELRFDPTKEIVA